MILDWARHVIDGSTDPNRTRMKTTPAEGSEAGVVGLLRFGSETAEARGVATLAKALIEREKIKPEKILVLLRSDHQGRFSKPLHQAFKAAGVPYVDTTVVKRMFAEDNNRKLVALLRLLVNRSDSLSWATLLQLTRGISDQFIDSVYELARQRRIQFGEALELAASGAVVLEPETSAQRASRLFEEMLAIIEGIEVPEETPDEGWGGWIESIVEEGDFPVPSAQLTELLGKIDVISDATSLGRYLGQIFPLAKDITQTESEGVRIMTMMSSKGLTVEATIVVGAEEGLMPHPNYELEEERRLLYVAMTRSKRFLFLSWAGTRKGRTARAGRGRPGRQNHSSFLNGGPVRSQDGVEYIRNRWPQK